MVVIAEAFPCAAVNPIGHPQSSVSLRFEAATHMPGCFHTPTRRGPTKQHGLGTNERSALPPPAAAALALHRPAVSSAAWFRSGWLADFNGASFDGKGLAMDQGIGHLPVRRLQDAAERLAGYVHLLRRLFLIEPFQVGQTDGLEFVNG